MTNILKKFWFVILVAVIFIGIIGVFINDKVSSVFTGKSVNGTDVVFEINGVNFTADEYYTNYYSGTDVMVSQLSSLLQKEIADQSITLTSDEISTYTTEAATTLKNYVSYGYDEASIQKQMKALGFTDFAEYYINSKKVDQIIQGYINEKSADLLPAFKAAQSPRSVSHILISMSDPDNPTADEKARMAAVDKALSEGKSFTDVAYDYSEDESTRVLDGKVGYIDSTDTKYDADFRAAALKLADGEVSGWVKTQFGYHLIKNDGSAFENFKGDSTFYSSVITYYKDDNLAVKALVEAGDKLTITFADNTMYDKIKAYWAGN